ncbi:MAG: hypothetical protein ACJAW7_002695 [Candidatus Azotimanducaceae bacterium]|jgi:hypothetical protein
MAIALNKAIKRTFSRRFFCDLTLRYHKITNYEAAIYGGVRRTDMVTS